MIHNCLFTATAEKYVLSCPTLGVELADSAVVGTFTKMNTTQELILSIGEPEDQIRADPTYAEAPADGHMRFIDPFRPADFSSRLAEGVVRFYVAKASSAKRGQGFFHSLLAILAPYRFNLVIDIEGYDEISPEKRHEFEKSLADNPLIKKYSIEEPSKSLEGIATAAANLQ